MEPHMTGARIIKVRPMTDDERELEGWESVPGDIIVGVYDNGAILYPACAGCDHPGDVWAMYGGQRWKIEPRAEVHVDPPAEQTFPSWMPPAVCATLFLAALAVVLLALRFVVD